MEKPKLDDLMDEPGPFQNRNARNQKQHNWDVLRRFGKAVGGFLTNAVDEVNNAVSDADGRMDDIEDRYNDQIAGNTDLDETLDARGGYGTLNERLNDGDKSVNRLSEIEDDFKLSNATPHFLASMEPVVNTPFQSFAIEMETKEIYMAQNTSEGDGYKTWLLSRHAADGRLLDHMTVSHGGHGTSFGLQNINGEVHVWSGYNTYDDAGNIVIYRLARFKYVPGSILTSVDCTFFDALIHGYTMPYVDQYNNILMLRSRDESVEGTYTQEYFDLYDLATIDSAKATPLYDRLTVNVTDFTDLGDKYTLQGYCNDGATVYVYSGYLNKTMRVISYDAKTGNQIDMRVVDVGKQDSINGYADGKVEAEGAAFFTDKVTGQRALLVGIAPGRNIVNHRSVIYAYPQRGALPILESSKQVEATYSMVGTGGTAKSLPVNVTMLSEIMTPGNYYIDSSAASKFTDFPDGVGVAGWYFDVSPKVVGGTVNQTLSRNSPNKLVVTTRVIQAGAVGEWVFTVNESNWVSVNLASGFTKYSDFGFQYRRIGHKQIQFRLEVAKDNSAAFATDPNSDMIGTLPPSIRPAYGQGFVGTGSGAKTSRIWFGTNGQMTANTKWEGVSWVAASGTYYLD